MNCRATLVGRIRATGAPIVRANVDASAQSLVVVNPLQVPIYIRFGPAVDLADTDGWDVAAPGNSLYSIPLSANVDELSAAAGDYGILDPGLDAQSTALIMVDAAPCRVFVGPLA
jgi:hypothetical protein